jgi:hypothetical protein
MSGYFTSRRACASSSRARARGAPRELAGSTPTVRGWFGQRGNDGVRELHGAVRARAARPRRLARARHGGSFAQRSGGRGGSAERLARSLAEMPLYRDVARYAAFDVPLYKRAQITAAISRAAFGGRGPGAFRDLDRAHDLRRQPRAARAALRGRADLRRRPARADRARRADRGGLAGGGGDPRVALHAVEPDRAALRARGVAASAQQLDSSVLEPRQRRRSRRIPGTARAVPYY